MHVCKAGPPHPASRLGHASNAGFSSSHGGVCMRLQIAFSSVSITLRHYLEDMASGNWHLHHGEQKAWPGPWALNELMPIRQKAHEIHLAVVVTKPAEPTLRADGWGSSRAQSQPL